jgi:hypothetical protein
MSDFASLSRGPAVQATVGDDPRTQTCTHCQKNHVPCALPSSIAMFSDGTGIRVIFESARNIKFAG